MKILAYLVVLLGCAGCASTLVTESKISFNPQTGLATLSLPKDSSWSNMVFYQTINTKGITNNIHLEISNGSFKNNPMVLNAQAAANVALLEAYSKLFQEAMKAGIVAGTLARERPDLVP